MFFYNFFFFSKRKSLGPGLPSGKVEKIEKVVKIINILTRLSTSTGKEGHFSGAQTMFERCMRWKSRIALEPTL